MTDGQLSDRQELMPGRDLKKNAISICESNFRFHIYVYIYCQTQGSVLLEDRV